MGIKFVGNHIENTELPKKFKKITGTRLGAVLGLNAWSTPFQAWCEITKTYEKPFEDTKFTIAGKVIEPKQADYLRETYFMKGLKTPKDFYGSDPFKTTYGDFYKDEPIFGGMWDYLNYEDGNLCDVIECKTTKRAEDWEDTMPVYYTLQGSLYAYLKGIDSVIMVCTFLDEKDYEHPENFKVTEDNTIVRAFKIHEYFPDFEEKIAQAREFWEKHVLTGISPDYDEKLDKEYLDALRKNNINPTTEIEELVNEYETLTTEINDVIATIKDKQERVDTLKDLIKEYMSNNIGDGQTKSEIKGTNFVYTLSKTQTKSIDKDLLKKDGLLPRYEKITESVRFTTKAIAKEEE